MRRFFILYESKSHKCGLEMRGTTELDDVCNFLRVDPREQRKSVANRVGVIVLRDD